MRQCPDKIRGFSLFEILLVLIISSIVAVSAMKYVEHLREIAADRQYGLNLYTFGQAVKQYVNDAKLTTRNTVLPGTDTSSTPAKNKAYTSALPNPVNSKITVSTAGGITTITATGVDWLKKANAGTNASGDSYLPDNFSFNDTIPPLIVAQPDPASGAATATGDAAFTTVITVNAAGPQIQVAVGALYEQVTGTDPATHKPLPPILRPSLTQDAIQYANTHYDVRSGAPAVQYTFPYINTTTGSITPGAQTTGQIVASPTDIYLRRDGSNTMLGTFAFDANATSKLVTGVKTITLTGAGSQINNIDSLQFNPVTPSKGSITGLNTMTMSAQVNKASTLQGLNTVQFQTVPANPTGVGASSISNLATLNFDAISLGVRGTINSLKILAFQGQSFTGNGTGDGNLSQIFDLDRVYFNKFGGDILFNGIAYAAGIGGYYANTAPNSGLTNGDEVCVNSTTNAHTMALPTNTFCFVTHIEFGDKNSGSNRKCYMDNGTHVLTGDNAGACCVQCFTYK